jgi:hypothetical protein
VPLLDTVYSSIRDSFLFKTIHTCKMTRSRRFYGIRNKKQHSFDRNFEPTLKHFFRSCSELDANSPVRIRSSVLVVRKNTLPEGAELNKPRLS